MSINDLYLLRKSLSDYILLLCDMDRIFVVSDVAIVLKTINEVIEEKEEDLL